MSATRIEVTDRFPNDVRDHALTVIQDEGLHRHLRFAKPGTYCMSFGIVTWRGYLCFYGDMGTFVFSRIDDMLEFFRQDKPNIGYWAEKCRAEDRSGVRRYDQDKFHERARELLKDRLEWLEESKGLDEETRTAVTEAFEEQVIRSSENEYDAHASLRDFDEHGVTFSDTWELNFQEYTYHFTWCCYALVWAIKQYDARRAEQAVTA